MRRQEIREMTMQVVYQMDVMNDFDYRNISLITENEEIQKENQALKTLDVIRDHQEDIDATINAHSDKWKTSRMAKTDLAILRIAVAEICYMDSIPDSVSIDEAVNMAKKYGENRSYAFINSVLGKIAGDK
ncbi:MAG: transcription antitermination factor NusB [Eubacteriales bacterium]|nr:transcription antitermination factor NusB [Eubacteriales bacterium]